MALTVLTVMHVMCTVLHLKLFWKGIVIFCPTNKFIGMKKMILLASVFMIGKLASAQTFTLKSNDVGGQATNKEFFNGFGCSGQNISPELHWENAPAGTQAFAVTIYDKDAPTGSGFWHWVIFNIPSDVMELKSGAGRSFQTPSLPPQPSRR